jgi:hypothetical protein
MLPLLVALAACACAPQAAPPPQAPPQAPAGTPPGEPPANTAAAFVVDGAVREEWMPLLKPIAVDPAKAKLLAPPPGLAPVPAVCEAFASRKPTGKPSCADAAAGLGALDAALERSDPGQRDAALVDLESCRGLPPALARSLRAELAPVECGEVILEPMLKAPPPSTDGILYAAMLGQAIASRLARTAHNAPTLAPPHDRARVLEFIKGPMRSWLEQQALAIETISQAAAELPYYGKGIAAVEAGIADLRLVEAVRSAPIPDDFKKDDELKSAYYGSLDQMLDPRKDRGRDAALVGLKELALVGVIKDHRVSQARLLLSRLYGGRRIDALDSLFLPPLPRATPSSLEERLASRLPTFYAGILLDEQAATRPGTLRQFAETGVPLQQRIALKKVELPVDARALYARAHLELGRLYWRAVDFDQAAALAASVRKAGGTAPSDDATFTLAVALALRNGPDDASDMMRKAPRALPPPHTAALDSVTSAAHANAGLAAYDAALLHQLGAPEGAAATYWTEVARRFHDAAAALSDPASRAAAEDRAKSAEAVAQAIAAQGTKPPSK